MQLSYSALSIFKECPRCFWLDRNKKILRPRGIFSSLPTGIDSILKEKLEEFRGKLPPMLKDYPQLEGFQLYDGDELKYMRNWKTNPLKMEDEKGNVLVGAFDDLLFNPTTKEYAFLDYKTKGSEPDQAYCEKYYQNQLDIYTRFLEAGGRKVATFGVLLYFWPETGAMRGNPEIFAQEIIVFKSKPFFLTPNTANAENLFRDAIECLEKEIPEPSSECGYCSYVLKRGDLR